jgi:hypothetical protein
MRTPDIEGVAIHGGPQSCVDDPRGWWRSVDRGTCRPAIEPRNHCFGVPTPSHEAEGHIAGGVSASRLVDPARSENLCVYGVLMRENREVPLLARPADHRAGRPGNAEAVSLG